MKIRECYGVLSYTLKLMLMKKMNWDTFMGKKEKVKQNVEILVLIRVIAFSKLFFSLCLNLMLFYEQSFARKFERNLTGTFSM